MIGVSVPGLRSLALRVAAALERGSVPADVAYCFDLAPGEGGEALAATTLPTVDVFVSHGRVWVMGIAYDEDGRIVTDGCSLSGAAVAVLREKWGEAFFAPYDGELDTIGGAA